MSDRTRRQPEAANGRRNSLDSARSDLGQALAEYVLILALVAIALIAVLTITGPAVGEVFSNAVFNLLGGTVVPRATLPADDFWQQVAAVASYTPENPLSITNTPGGVIVTEETEPPGGEDPTEEPPGGEDPTEEPPGGEDPTEEPETPEPTAEPTEPPDIEFPYPFQDTGNNPDWWDTGPDNVLGEWNAEFWDYDGSRTNMNGFAPGTGKWSTTYGVLDHYWTGSPGGTVKNDFYARFTTTATLENEEYQLRLRKDDGMRVWVGGVLVFNQWSWTDYNWKTIPFTPAAGTHEVVVELFDSGSAGAASLFITQDGAAVNCNWSLTDETFYSAPTAWTDSAGGNYAPFSTCVLRLRGTIDLTGAVDPKLEFYDRYAIGTGAVAKVGVAIAGSNTWTEVTAHSTGSNLSWTRQLYDLANFGGQDFRDQVIELRFVLDNPTSNTGDGWWVDDIMVEEQPTLTYTVGFSDNMEGPSHWFAGGSWARTNEWPHSPANAWSDSPNTSYSRNTDSVLELDGKIVLDNDQLEGDPVVQPEMVFWHRYELGSGATAYAEISLDERQTWTRLTGTHLVSGATNKTYSQVVIPLDAYIGQSFYFRFRINTTSSATIADGWYIDDFALRNRYDGLIHLNWCDDLESGGGSWLPMGSWVVAQGSDDNPGQNVPITAHSGSSFFSDSFERNYEHGTNSILQLEPRLNLTNATRPELTFWHQWDIEQGEKLVVEVSTNLGQTWTPIWTKTYGALPPGFASNTRTGDNLYFDSVLSWTHQSVDLSSYVGTELMLRFRLDATSNSRVDDGWFLDDICVQERVEPVYTLPFSENFQGGTGRWHWGGTWERTGDNPRTGSFVAEDSPGGPYGDNTVSVLTLRGAIDLRGAVEPTLYIWDRFTIGEKYDHVMVEARASNGEYQPWTNWERLDVTRNTLSTTWTRRQIGTHKTLESFVGKLVQLRFTVYAETGYSVSDGWYLDSISVMERAGESVFTVPFRDDAETDNDYWIFDGTWARTPTMRPLGSGSELGPGGWQAEYFHAPNPNATFAPGTGTGSQVEAEIDINWGSFGPIGVRMDGTIDNFFVRFERNIMVEADGTVYEIQARSDDRIRVFVDGARVINAWSDRGYNDSNPDTTEVTLSAGPHNVVVEYYENGGSAQVKVDFAQITHVYTDSPMGNYVHGSNASMTLEGMIDLTGVTNPVLTFWNRRARGSSDSFYVEVSTDGGYTWSEAAKWTNTVGWQKDSVSLGSHTNKTINIRFRMDARSNSGVSDGWYIDDIQVIEAPGG